MSTEVIENEVEAEETVEVSNEETQPVESEEAAEPSLSIQQSKKLALSEMLDEIYPEFNEAERLHNKLKSDTKKAKEKLDEVQAEVNQLVRRIYEIDHGGQQYLPLGGDSHPDVEAGKDRPHGTPLVDAVAKMRKEDPGKKTSVHDLEITEKQADALVDQSIYMVTDLEERIRNASMGGYSWHTDVEGIGKGKATAVEDALEAWRRENPIPCDEDDDEPVEVEAEATEEEPDTIPMPNQDLEWWCCECDHTWPEDGNNDVCPECENETGNQLVGYHGCPDSNEYGVIVRGFEEVMIIDDDEVTCTVGVYKAGEARCLSSIVIIDNVTPYSFSNDLDLKGPSGSCSRDAAIWNQLMSAASSEFIPDIVAEGINTYIKLHLSKMDADQFECVNCAAEYRFDKDCPEKPHCPFCCAVEHTAVD